MVPRMDLKISGMGSFKGGPKDPTAFANLLREDGSPAESLVISDHSTFRFKKTEMPFGPHSVPLSVVVVDGLTFFLESSP